MNQMIVVNFPLEIFSNDHFYIHYKNILNVFFIVTLRDFKNHLFLNQTC